MPAMNNLLSKWIPVSERSRSLALVYSGMYLGSVTGLAFSPILIQKFGWPSVFYSFGSLGSLWFALWWSKVRPPCFKFFFLMKSMHVFPDQQFYAPHHPPLPTGKLLRWGPVSQRFKVRNTICKKGWVRQTFGHAPIPLPSWEGSPYGVCHFLTSSSLLTLCCNLQLISEIVHA